MGELQTNWVIQEKKGTGKYLLCLQFSTQAHRNTFPISCLPPPVGESPWFPGVAAGRGAGHTIRCWALLFSSWKPSLLKDWPGWPPLFLFGKEIRWDKMQSKMGHDLLSGLLCSEGKRSAIWCNKAAVSALIYEHYEVFMPSICVLRSSIARSDCWLVFIYMDMHFCHGSVVLRF